MFKNFLIKIKGDSKQLFFYPTCDYGANFAVDYGKYWNKRREVGVAVLSDWQRQRAEEALKIISPGSLVLDIGCGDGLILDYLKQKAGIKPIGVDIDQEALEKARSVGIESVCLDVSDVKNISALPEADYITAFEILEHMATPETFIHYILTKTKKGLIFSLPNTGYYAHRLRLLFGRFPLQWVVHPGEHLRFWTVRDMEFWVASMGLKIEKMVLYEGLPVLSKLFPKLFAQGMIVFIKKEDKDIT